MIPVKYYLMAAAVTAFIGLESYTVHAAYQRGYKAADAKHELARFTLPNAAQKEETTTFNYITLGVADLAASRRFYREIFGWQERGDSNEHIAFFQAGSALILALFPREALAADANVAADGSGFPRFTLAHNVASREAVDALFAAFVAQGVTIVKPPQAVFWGGYSGYISDPDGFLWEIAHNPYLEKLR